MSHPCSRSSSPRPHSRSDAEVSGGCAEEPGHQGSPIAGLRNHPRGKSHRDEPPKPRRFEDSAHPPKSQDNQGFDTPHHLFPGRNRPPRVPRRLRRRVGTEKFTVPCSYDADERTSERPTPKIGTCRAIHGEHAGIRVSARGSRPPRSFSRGAVLPPVREMLPLRKATERERWAVIRPTAISKRSRRPGLVRAQERRRPQ